jgi:hypothetical protein
VAWNLPHAGRFAGGNDDGIRLRDLGTVVTRKWIDPCAVYLRREVILRNLGVWTYLRAEWNHGMGCNQRCQSAAAIGYILI